MTEGRKDDQEKIPLGLLSTSWIFGVGKVLGFGARKYAAHNWRNGIALSRLLGACLRHVLAFLGGEDSDPETGLSHLYHASCCLMFASEIHETRPDLDDRYKPGPRPCAHVDGLFVSLDPKEKAICMTCNAKLPRPNWTNP